MVTSEIGVSGQRFKPIKTCRNVYGNSELIFEANGFGGKLCWGQLSSGKRPHELVEILRCFDSPALDKNYALEHTLEETGTGRPGG